MEKMPMRRALPSKLKNKLNFHNLHRMLPQPRRFLPFHSSKEASHSPTVPVIMSMKGLMTSRFKNAANDDRDNIIIIYSYTMTAANI